MRHPRSSWEELAAIHCSDLCSDLRSFGGRGVSPSPHLLEGFPHRCLDLGTIRTIEQRRDLRHATLAALGHPERYEGFNSWSTPNFEVTSGGPIDLGLDGETQVMDPPLRFSIRPDPVRVRLPRHALGYSPAALSIGWRQGIRDLWGIVLGRPSRFQG